MKRFQIVLIVIPLLYWAGCGDDDNGDNEGNPVISGRTIYIVGSDGGGACSCVVSAPPPVDKKTLLAPGKLALSFASSSFRFSVAYRSLMSSTFVRGL